MNTTQLCFHNLPDKHLGVALTADVNTGGPEHEEKGEQTFQENSISHWAKLPDNKLCD